MHKVFKIVLVMMLAPFAVHAVSLTADQLRMVEQLSPQDKATLAQQYGVSVPQDGESKKITSPQTIQQRNPEKGVLEADAAISADARISEQNEGESANIDVPIALVDSQGGADKAELRQAFADFVRESKPLQVDVSQLKQFGYDLFAGAPSTFAPATDVPVPAEYVLGPGDELEIQLFGQKMMCLH